MKNLAICTQTHQNSTTNWSCKQKSTESIYQEARGEDGGDVGG